MLKEYNKSNLKENRLNISDFKDLVKKTVIKNTTRRKMTKNSISLENGKKYGTNTQQSELDKTVNKVSKKIQSCTYTVYRCQNLSCRKQNGTILSSKQQEQTQDKKQKDEENKEEKQKQNQKAISRQRDCNAALNLYTILEAWCKGTERPKSLTRSPKPEDVLFKLKASLEDSNLKKK
jgi:hypothetical protein